MVKKSDMDALRTLNERLDVARAAGWQNKQIADAIDCSETHFSRMLKNPKYLRGKTVARLNQWLDANGPVSGIEEQALREISDVVQSLEPALRRTHLTFAQKLDLLDANLRVLTQVVQKLREECRE